MFAQVFAGLDLDFDPEMLAWEPCERVELDNLGGEHSHLYQRVLASSGIEPPDERIPEVAEFANIDGLEDHPHRCMEVYERLVSRPERITPRND